jgi:hypothetical protein
MMFDKWALAIGLLGTAVFGMLFYYTGGRLSSSAELLFGLFVLAAGCAFILGMLTRRRNYI